MRQRTSGIPIPIPVNKETSLKFREFVARFPRFVPLWVLATALTAAALASACGGGSSSTTVSTPLSVVKPIADCSALASVDITDIGGAGSAIASAAVVGATTGGVTTQLCVVKGTLAPSNNFEVALPVSSWTQRFAALGCGGLCGNVNDPTAQSSFSFSYGCPLVQQVGFVTAATDMGHSGNGSAWTTNPQQQADFAYRGQHITSLAAKKLIQAYYGQAPAYSYFIGCSDGGREALMAAQRYPMDYNGIVAGAPAAHFQIQNSLYHGWSVESNSTTGDSTGNVVLYADKVSLLHKAVIAACGGQSGAPDGLLADPRACTFDPASIACPAGATSTTGCLTAAEVNTAGKIYGGPLDVATGERMLAGSPQFGSEGNWIGVEVPNANSTDGPVPVAQGLFSYLIVSGAYRLIFTGSPTLPNIDTFGYTDAGFYANFLQANHPLNDATNPDLSAFNKAGGKLILWHGWADQHISPLFTIDYFDAMQSTMGASTVGQFARLYLVPGVAHCGGGEGFPNIDLVSQITGWVEQGSAPNAVTTYQTDASNTVTATRPVYPYPAVALYSGTGDWHSAANYVQGGPLYNAAPPAWAGSSFYSPYAAASLGVAAP